MTTELVCDVVAVDLFTNTVRVIGREYTQKNAEAVCNMAVMRHGVDDEFFAVVQTGTYLSGEDWEGGAL